MKITQNVARSILDGNQEPRTRRRVTCSSKTMQNFISSLDDVGEKVLKAQFRKDLLISFTRDVVHVD